jgi:aminoglycoside phosphotransferase family enzyme
VQLNNRLSDIYLDVVPVTYQNGSWYIGKCETEIKDYAVRMKRMRSNRKMDIMLERNEVSKGHLVALAKTIATFHKRSKIVKIRFKILTARALFNDIRVWSGYIGKYLGGTYQDLIGQAIRWSNDFLNTYAPCFQERIFSGLKRDVHGDLHAGNIFLYKKPIIFDCIEFNDSYRQIDVINEVAFLCMDLEFNGKKTLSRFFLSEYLRHLPCVRTKTDSLLFIYFKCYHANIRAKVNIINAQQTSDRHQTFQKSIQAARIYLQLMRTYIVLTDQKAQSTI